MPQNQAISSFIPYCHGFVVENGHFDLGYVSPSLQELCFTEIAFFRKGLELIRYEHRRHAKCNVSDQKSEFSNSQIIFLMVCSCHIYIFLME